MASLQGTSEMGLEKGQIRIDAEETISSREKVMEMTYSLSPKTRMTGYHRKVTGARLGTHKRRLPFGQHSNDLVERCSGGFKFSWPQVETEQGHRNKTPPRLLGATLCDDGCLQ